MLSGAGYCCKSNLFVEPGPPKAADVSNQTCAKTKIKTSRLGTFEFWLEVLNNFITNRPDILVDLGRKTDLFYEHLELSDPLLFKTIKLTRKNIM